MATDIFLPDTIYETCFACDADAKLRAFLVKRTAKTVTLEIRGYGRKTCRVSLDADGVEYCRPLGSYSMSPFLRADKIFYPGA